MNWLGNQKGGITVFQCIILMSLLLFAGAIMDIARIVMAENEVQSAVNAAARSVLAGYDEELVGDYGLFALNMPDRNNAAEGEFVKYLSANLQVQNKGFSLIKYRVDAANTSVRGYRSLMDNNALSDGILQYMKYRMPLLVTQNIIDKFNSSGIFKKKEYAAKEKDVREKRSGIKKKIMQLNNNIAGANDAVTSIISYSINNVDSGRGYINKLLKLKAVCIDSQNVIEASVQDMNSYIAAVLEAEKYARESNTDSSLQNESAIRTYGQEFGNSNAVMNVSKDEINVMLRNIDSLIPLLEPVQSQVELLTGVVKPLEAANNSIKTYILKCKPQEGEIKKLQQTIQENDNKIAELRAQISSYIGRMNAIKAGFKPQTLGGINLEEAADMPGEAPEKGKDESSTMLEELKKKFSNLLSNKRLQDEWLIDENGLKQAQLPDMEKYDELKRIPYSEEDIEEVEKQNENVFSFIDKIKAAFEGSAQNIYTVEYIMDRFTYRTSLTERGHYFPKGEVEYILWGNKSQNANIASTISTIGFLRFAINTIDYFATSKVPHPVFRAVYSAGKGLLQSFKDCFQLFQGKRIDLCPSLNKSDFKLNYADHLRVLLLLQSKADKSRQFNNIRQLIQVNIKNPDAGSELQNSSFRLTECNTVLEAKTSVDINLWFLPLLQLEKLGIPNFKGGRYVISREIHVDY